MDKGLDLFCSIKFAVLEMRPAYLIVLEILLDSMTALTLKMQVSRALQVYYSLVIVINPECMAQKPRSKSDKISTFCNVLYTCKYYNYESFQPIFITV